MNGEGRIPPLLIAGLVFIVLAIGALAYYAGRFGRPGDRPLAESPIELPPPGPPDPAVAQALPTPAEMPPTVAPSAAVEIGRETRTSRTTRSSAPLVERSTQIEVKVPAVIPTARFPGASPTPLPTPGRRIVVEVVTPALVPTPELDVEEPQDETPPEVTHAPPEITPGLMRGGAPALSGLSGVRSRSL